MGDTNQETGESTPIKLIDLDGLSTYHDLMDAKKEEHSVTLTLAQYNALSPEEKMNGKTYYISDAGSSGMIITASDVLMTGYSKASSASAITTNDTGSIAFGKLEKGLDDVSSDVDDINGLIPSTATVSNKLATASDIPDVSNFITKAVNDLTYYYTSSNTYTKTEVDNLIAAAKNGRFVVVNSLPTSDIDTKVIYLVPKSTAQTNNVYDEYINTDGTSAGWEKIGDTQMDLTNYVQKSSTSGLIKNDGTIDTSTYLTDNGVEANPSGSATTSLTKISVDGTVYSVDGVNTLSGLTDTTITSPSNGQVLTYNSTSSKWENQAASGGGGNTVSKTRYQISSSSWSSSANADGYYTLTATLNPAIGSSPDVYVAGSADGTQPTDTEKGQFAYVKRCKVNGSTLTLYASSKPSSTFYIWVEGVNGTGSGDIVGNVIQPNGESSGGSGSLTPFTLTQNDRLSNVQGGYRVDGDIVTVDLFAKLLVEPANTIVFPDLVTSGMDSRIVGLPVPKYRTNVYMQLLYLTYNSGDNEYIAYANGFALIDSYPEGSASLTHLVLGRYSNLNLSQQNIYIRCYGTYQKQ